MIQFPQSFTREFGHVCSAKLDKEPSRVSLQVLPYQATSEANDQVIQRFA